MDITSKVILLLSPNLLSYIFVCFNCAQARDPPQNPTVLSLLTLSTPKLLFSIHSWVINFFNAGINTWHQIC